MLGSATKLQTKRNIKLQGAVSGNADFDGSGNVVIETAQANIAVITGSFSIEASTAKKVKTISYPNGFTSNNCTVISFGTYYHSSKGYSFGHHSNDSIGLLLATNDRDITLCSDGIELWYNNIVTDSVTIYYQVVLLKIS